MKPDRKFVMLIAALVIALFFLPFVTDALLGRGWVRILDFAMLYIMLALGLNIVVGYAGLLDLGYIAFFAVGAYCYALTDSPHLAQAFPMLFPVGVHLPFWIVLPMAALVAGGFGVLLGAPTLRLRGDYLAIVTLGFGEIIRIFLNNRQRARQSDQRPAGHQFHRSDQRAVCIAEQDPDLFRHRVSFGASVFLSVPGIHRAGDFRFAAAGKIAHRAGLDGDTRRRGRRVGDGHQHAQPEAAGVRDGRDVRRRVRRAVCRFPGLCQPGKFQPDGIHHGAVHGGAGRDGHTLPA